MATITKCKVKRGGTAKHILWEGTWQEYVEHARHGATNKHRIGTSSTETGAYRQQFTGTASLDEACQFAANGWREGYEGAKALSATIGNLVANRLEVVDDVSAEFDTAGAYVDVGRYLEGEPENMVQFTSAQRSMPVAHVVVNNVASCAINAESMKRRAIAMAAAVDALEAGGIRCEVTLTIPSGTEDSWATIAHIKVKRPDEPLALERLVFWLGHPATLRRLQFATMEGLEYDEQRALGVGGGYGQVWDTYRIDGADIFSGGAAYNAPQWQSPQATADWIVEQLKGLGVELKATTK